MIFSRKLRKTSWEKKVEFVKSEFRNYLLVEKELDPFVLLNITDAYRSREKYGSDATILNYAGTANNLGNAALITPQSKKMGLTPKGDEDVNEGGIFIYSLSHNGKVYYPIFYLKNKGGDKVYRYLGNINLKKILDDQLYDDPNYKTIVKDYVTPAWEAAKANTDVDIMSFLKIRPLPTITGYNFDSLYLTKIDYSAIKSYRNLHGWNVRFLYTFIESAQSNGICSGAKAGANNFKMKYLSKTGNLTDISDMTRIKTVTAGDMLNIQFGQVYEIDPTWKDLYFPATGNIQLSKYVAIPYLNEDPYVSSGRIGLKN